MVSRAWPLAAFLLAITGVVAALGTARRHPRASAAARAFQQRYRRALTDPLLARNLLGFQQAWRPARQAAFAAYAEAAPGAGQRPAAAPEAVFAALRDEMAAVKDAVLDDLPRYLAQFRAAAERAGAVVVEAADAEAACQYVAEIVRRRGARLVVKGKSMVSEEIDLNRYLAARGVEVVETDLGEWIVQLAGERPSHMVMPAIHKSRQQVGDLFSRALGRAVSRDAIPEQVAVARATLREKFLAAEVGITGANALIAETGTVLLVTNEGNGRLVTTLPPVHIVLVGYEKLVPTYADAVRQLRLLARSATAQPITSYTTFITGPAAPDHELHIVLVDNGRFAMRADAVARAALRCLRCGACANVCPPYQVVGGHVFGHIYTGAIGLVNTPFHHGLEAAAGPQGLCVSCHACAPVCPVGIPLPHQILAVRERVATKLGLPAWKRLALAVWARPRLADAVCRLAARALAPFARDGLLVRLPLPAAHRWRWLPAPARRPARDRLAAQQVAAARSASGPTIACFLQCVADRLCPEVAVAAVDTLRACEARAVVPRTQHCCGLPALDAGDRATARRMARQTIAALEATPTDYVTSPGASCLIAMQREYPALFAGDPVWEARARALAARVVDFGTLLARLAPAGAPAGDRDAADARPVVTYHPFCQTLNRLGQPPAPRGLLEDTLGLKLCEQPEAHVCCGFGGFTSLEHPAVARQIAARKLASVGATGAAVLVTDNPGCLLHLRGAAAAAGVPLRVVHLAEIAAERLASGTAVPRVL
jgi:iron-sulfur cluster protein